MRWFGDSLCTIATVLPACGVYAMVHRFSLYHRNGIAGMWCLCDGLEILFVPSQRYCRHVVFMRWFIDSLCTIPTVLPACGVYAMVWRFSLYHRNSIIGMWCLCDGS